MEMSAIDYHVNSQTNTQYETEWKSIPQTEVFSRHWALQGRMLLNGHLFLFTFFFFS